MKILGVGWAKTGTTSLGEAMDILGYRHRTQMLPLTDALDQPGQSEIWKVVEQHDSFEDWPWLLLFREFDERYPGTKFILTVRETEAWLKSYRKQLDRADTGKQMTEWRRRLYGLPFPEVSDQQLIDRYEQHNTDIREYFAGRPDDLLIVDWARGDGWAELCRFLDTPVPNAPFPRANVAPSRGVIREQVTRAARKIRSIVAPRRY